MSGTAHSKVILDIGRGAGWLLSQARKRLSVAELIGADPAEEALEGARKVVPDAMLVLAPAGFLPSWWNRQPRSELDDMKHGLQDLGKAVGRRSGRRLTDPEAIRRICEVIGGARREIEEILRE